MTPEERLAAFAREVEIRRRALPELQAEAAEHVIRLLEEAAREISLKLAGVPSEFEIWRLGQLRREVEILLAAFGEAAGLEAARAFDQALDAGAALVSEPLKAARLTLSGVAPRLDPVLIASTRSFTIWRINDLSTEARVRIETDLGLWMMGARSREETLKRLQTDLGGETRRRALTILNTETARAHGLAAQKTLEESAKSVPMLKKKWLRSGKARRRANHEAAHGQIRDVDEPFSIAGELLMHPCDPKGSPENTVNCGCSSIPHLDLDAFLKE